MSNVVNPQVVDSVTKVNAYNIGAAPAFGMDLTYESLGNTISTHMENAVTNQRSMQVITTAATTVLCATIIAFGAKA